MRKRNLKEIIIIISLLLIAVLLLSSSNVASANEHYIGKYKLTTYYTPIATQTRTDRNYHQDLVINCQGDCLVTASGYRLSGKDAFRVMACPPNFKFGTKLRMTLITGYWRNQTFEATCQDRGGAIKGRRLDLWSGIGDDAWIGKFSGYANIYLIN